MSREDEVNEILQWVCIGDDVECGIADVVKLVVAHINTQSKLSQYEFRGIFRDVNEISDDGMVCVEVMSNLGKEMLKCLIRNLLDSRTVL
jgi:hypothetical protein